VARPSRRAVAAAQAAYYLPTAVSPFVSRRAFEAVTGPKREWWLVQTVGLLVGAVGAGLAVAARDDDVGPDIALVGAGSAAALAAIDVVYAGRGRIRWTYLLDAAAEAACVAGWLAARRAQSE
jgi:hypothetical protein